MKDYVPGFEVEGVWVPRSGPVDWDAVFRHYSPAVRAYVRSRVPAAAVDDAVQDTFERAFRSRDRFDPSRPMWPWLVTIAKRACIEVQRRRGNEVAIDLRADQVAAVDDPHREYERRQQAVAISYALSTLTQRHRRLLIGWEVEGRRFDHLAAEEGLSRQALKSVLCRARNGFRVGYTAIAERAGLAAFAFGRLLGRGRDRLHRASTLTPGAEFALGGMVVGMTAATLLVVLPVTQSAAEAKRLRTAHAATSAAASAPVARTSPTSTPAGPAWKRGPGPASAYGADGGEPTPGPARSRFPRAGGGADVKVAPTGPQASLTVEWEEERIGGRARITVTTDCTGGAWDVACLLIRSVPAED